MICIECGGVCEEVFIDLKEYSVKNVRVYRCASCANVLILPETCDAIDKKEGE